MKDLIKDGNKYYHKVKTGETLWNVSKLYDVSIEQLQNLNKIKSVSLSDMDFVLVYVKEDSDD